MNNIRLFCDRVGHPSRFCLHFLQLNKIPHKEVPVLLLKGEPAKHPELPFGKVPVFRGTLTGSTYDEVVITESTTILKYLADKLPNDKWYPKNSEKRVKVDEFTDFFHFSMNAVSKIQLNFENFQFSNFSFQSLIRTIQAKVFYRLMFKRSEPDWNTINANLEKFQQAEKDLLSYYLGKNDFIGGKDLNICDLIATSTFEQVRLTLMFLNLFFMKFFQFRPCYLTMSKTQRLKNTLKDAKKRLMDMMKC